jgi:predicted 2-oxoglutarate/Fe(II)-dependent dioxygenase YbiX
MVKEAEKRSMLYELGQAREVMLAKDSEAEETSHVSNVYANLLRRWSEV